MFRHPDLAHLVTGYWPAPATSSARASNRFCDFLLSRGDAVASTTSIGAKQFSAHPGDEDIDLPR
jgi:hypothetical protein